MKIDELLAEARDTLTVKRVFGEPYEKDGVTFIPAAAVSGGAGGGEGEREGEGGAGGGYGLKARPVGAYQIKDGQLSWVPAADTTRVIIFGQVVAIAALLVIRSIVRSRRRRRG